MQSRRAARLASVLFFAIALGSAPAIAVGVGEAAPELVGLDGWIGAAPQSIAGLRGRVVIVNFWTFACHNCRNTLPHVTEWQRRFGARGLSILGIHTPELASERPREAVEAAVRQHGIEYAVALDPEFATWNAYGNRYWPAFYFIDRRGVVRHIRFGDGGYDDSATWIERLLAEPAE